MAKKARAKNAATPASKKRATRKAPRTSTSAALTAKGWRMVNRQQLAVLMGVAVDTVTHWAKEGMPVRVSGGRGKESQYDAVACLDWQRQRIGKNAKEAAQTRAITRQAELNELKLAQARRELVPVVDVVKAGQLQVMAWRAKVLGLARRMVQTGAIPRESEARVRDACRDLLTDISQWRGAEDYAAAVTENPS